MGMKSFIQNLCKNHFSTPQTSTSTGGGGGGGGDNDHDGLVVVVIVAIVFSFVKNLLLEYRLCIH